MNKIIEFKNVHFGYTSDDILKCISFDVNRGDFVSIIGSNGAGKSTILKLILGELHQYRGSIKLYEEDISKFKDWKKIGYLEQNAYSKILHFPATVYEIVMSNNFSDIGLFKFPNKKHKEKVMEVLTLLGMEKYKDRLDYVHFKDIKLYKDRLADVGIMATPLQFMAPKIPGHGDVDWGAFVSALTDIGYDGYGCQEIEDRAYEASIEMVKKSIELSTHYLRSFV